MTQPPEQPGPRSAQPWYDPPTPPAGPPFPSAEPRTVIPGNGPRRRFSPKVLASVAAGVTALALLAAGAVYALTGGDEQDPKPEANGAGAPSASASPSKEKEQPPPDLEEGRKPDEAHVWAAWKGVGKLPGRRTELHDMWIVGDAVVQAAYKEVTAYRLSDGKRLWSVPLPGEVCDTPVDISSDSKVVIAHTNGKTDQAMRCNRLQMVDLKAGKAGWEKTLVDVGGPSELRLAIAGDVVAVSDDFSTYAFQVLDGQRQFATGQDGYCSPDDVASAGKRLLQVDYCTSSTERFWGGVRELDPKTGRTLWKYRAPGDWEVSKVLSVSPLVLLESEALDMSKWRVVVVGKDHKKHRALPEFQKFITKHKFKPCHGKGADGGVQNCLGTVTDGKTLAFAHNNMAAAFDLRSGKKIWGVSQDDGGSMYPLSVHDAKVAVYQPPRNPRNGGVVEFGSDPAKDDEKSLLKHPGGARLAEAGGPGGCLYREGQLLVAPSALDGNHDATTPRLLSFKAP